MMEFIEYIAFICLAGAGIGFILLVVGNILRFINYLTEGKFEDSIIRFFYK